MEKAEIKRKLAQQERRLSELAAFLPKGDAVRGEKLFNMIRTDLSVLPVILKARRVFAWVQILTWIGAIRSERDLLEAIVYPSASIARYHEVVNVVTKDGKTISGLLVRETVEQDVPLVSRRQRSIGTVSRGRTGEILKCFPDARRSRQIVEA